MSATFMRWAPVYEKWPPPHSGSLDYRHEGDFVDADPLFSDKAGAERYSQNNRGNYPYCTTGRAVQVKVTVEMMK